MQKQKPILKAIEKNIIQLIDKSTKPLTTNEIAEQLGISYVTAQKYVKLLLSKKILEAIN